MIQMTGSLELKRASHTKKCFFITKCAKNNFMNIKVEIVILNLGLGSQTLIKTTITY